MPNNNPQQTTPQQQIARAAEGANKAATRLGEGAEHATSVAIEKVRQVRDEAQSGIEHQRAEVADRIRRLSGVLRASSETLSTDDPLAQQLFSSAGERIEQVADYIASITPGELANDVTSLARRRPGLFFGGSFILGLALGRFVKSSASAASSGIEGDEDDYEDTLAVRPAKRSGRRARRHAQTQTASAQASSGARAASSAASSPAYGAASSVTTASRPASSSSSTPAQSSSGTTAPSASSTPAQSSGSTPAQSSSSTPASSTARDVERGEGSKS